MTTIALNALFLQPGRVGGAEFMLYGLAEGLVARAQTVLIFAPDSAPLDSDFLTRTEHARSSGQLRVVPVAIRGNRFVSETLVVPRLASSMGVHALLSPNYYTPPISYGIQTLTSILDLQYLHFPQFFSLQKRLWLRAAHELTLRRATFVTTISDFVRDDLLERYGRRFEEKITTVPIGIDWTRFTSPIRPRALHDRKVPFILSVASHYSHKNLATLLRAFAQLAAEIPHDLVLVGQRRARLVGVQHGEAVDLDDLAHELGISRRVVLTGYATDGEVGWCYRHADLFAFPSLFEGFGMPAVEALGLGLPTVTTDRGSLPEVTHGLAQVVDDPLDPDELATVMRAMLDDPSRFRPTPVDVAMIREYYAPSRIAQLYLDSLRGGVT